MSLDIFDVDGQPLAGRYISNAKGIVTEEYCAIYFADIIHPSMGRPKSRDTHLRQQRVVICNGVGTHLGYSVVKKAVEMVLAIVLRVPHLSHIMQGEDTVNTKELKSH